MPESRKGRGALRNPANRFEGIEIEPFDDGWGNLDLEPPPLVTELIPEKTRRAITQNDSPDVGFDRTINPYKGCEHGCIYCFARPTHSYLGLSPGLDFESKIFTKPDAPRLLREELRHPGYEPRLVVLGANTDPYQPAERALRISRAILQVFAEHRHPVSMITKSSLVLRDLDVLAPMAAENLTSVNVSVTTLDRELARRMEPRAATPERRIDAIRALAEAGVPVNVLVAPMIPSLNDHELETILEACAAAGARRAGYVLVRLPHEIKGLFTEWIEANYPGRAGKVLHQIREMRGGKLYDSTWGKRMRGEGPYADLLERRFEVASRRLGLDGASEPLDTTRFRVPARAGDQRSLFP